MIPRRGFLAGSAAFAALPFHACAAAPHEPPRMTVAGRCEQASLVVGKCASAPSRVSLDGNRLRCTDAGVFAFGLAYDQTRMADLAAEFPDGLVEHLGVIPLVRKYDVQAVNGLPQNTVTPPKEVEERIARENALVAAARKLDSDLTSFADPFDWPIKGIVSGTFGNRRIDNGKEMAPHFGVDIAAADGTPIHAPADGTVTLAEPDFYLTGGTTMLDHGHGVSTVYLHQSALKVKVGDRIKRGEIIGLVGMKGRATGPHLHWGMNWFQMRLDPSRSAATPEPGKG